MTVHVRIFHQFSIEIFNYSDLMQFYILFRLIIVDGLKALHLFDLFFLDTFNGDKISMILRSVYIFNDYRFSDHTYCKQSTKMEKPQTKY